MGNNLAAKPDYSSTPIHIGPENLNTETSEVLQTPIEQMEKPSINGIPPPNNQLNVNQTAAQQLKQQDKASVSVFDAKMKGSFENSLDKVTNSSQGVGDQQSAQMLETALNVTSHQSNQSIDTPQHTEQPKPVSQSATGVSATPSTTITKEISSGDHPHLDETTNKAVQDYFNPKQTPTNQEASVCFMERLQKKGIIDQEGNIIFNALLSLNEETINVAGIQGKIYLDKNHEVIIETKENNNPQATQCLKALKEGLDIAKTKGLAGTEAPTLEVNTKSLDSQILLSELKNQGIIDEKGKIDFKALELDKKTIKNAGIKGEVFIKEDGSFDFKISGKCSNEAVECMQAFKDKLEGIINKDGETKLDIPININPASVGPLSAEDQAALANGGQIQYRSLPNGEVMKLTLDPGSNGKGDGLTIGVYKPGKDHSLERLSLSPKIPLNVVFEGAELNGKKVGPFLKDWRESKFFENSVIHTETNLIGTKTRRTNEDDVGRIQTQNKLWNAVNEYLKASVETSEGHFDINNDVKPSNTQTKEQRVEQNENNVPDKNKTENEVNNNGNLSGDFGEIHELSSSKSVNFNSTSTSADLENATTISENQQGIVGKEENTQQQAQTINSLGTNTAVNIDTKASSAQSNSINYQPENIENLNAGGIKANHSVKIENVTITNENSSTEQLAQAEKNPKSNTPIKAVAQNVKQNTNKQKQDNAQRLLKEAKAMQAGVKDIIDTIVTTDYNTFLINFDSKINTFQVGLTQQEKQTINQICNDFKKAIEDFKNQNEQLLASEALEVYFAALAPLEHNPTMNTEQKIETMKTILQPATEDLKLATKILKDNKAPTNVEIVDIEKTNKFMSKAAIGFIHLKNNKGTDQANISYTDAIQQFNEKYKSTFENFNFEEINF